MSLEPTARTPFRSESREKDATKNDCSKDRSKENNRRQVVAQTYLTQYLLERVAKTWVGPPAESASRLLLMARIRPSFVRVHVSSGSIDTALEFRCPGSQL